MITYYGPTGATVAIIDENNKELKEKAERLFEETKAIPLNIKVITTEINDLSGLEMMAKLASDFVKYAKPIDQYKPRLRDRLRLPWISIPLGVACGILITLLIKELM